jgi:hypothetical protein
MVKSTRWMGTKVKPEGAGGDDEGKKTEVGGVRRRVPTSPMRATSMTPSRPSLCGPGISRRPPATGVVGGAPLARARGA